MEESYEIEESEQMEIEEPKEEPVIIKPEFQPLTPKEMNSGKNEVRKIFVPSHRMTPLKNNWLKIAQPIVEHLKLQIRMNVQTRHVEIKTSEYTQEIGSLQKATDFVYAYLLGFEIEDAIALLRLDDLYIETFTVEDVRPLHGEHLSRAIGRIAGKDGKTKFTIENVTRTRIVLADKKIHILGTFGNIKIARDAICDLILGSPPGKVYAKLRTIASRMKERF